MLIKSTAGDLYTACSLASQCVMCERRKTLSLRVHCCEAEDAYGERENGLAKAKDQHIKSRIGISITVRPCVFCVLRSTCRHSNLFCAQHSGRRDGFLARTVSPNYYHTRRNASRDAISAIICRAFLRTRVYFALRSMLYWRRMPSGHTAAEKTQHMHRCRRCFIAAR
jgi:hypothetical protein